MSWKITDTLDPMRYRTLTFTTKQEALNEIAYYVRQWRSEKGTVSKGFQTRIVSRYGQEFQEPDFSLPVWTLKRNGKALIKLTLNRTN